MIGGFYKNGAYNKLVKTIINEPRSVELGSADNLHYGDPNTDTTWKTVRSGTKLSFQRRETGSYIEKGFFDTASFHADSFHAMADAGISGSYCVHPGTTPDANSDGPRLWVDSNEDLYLLKQNADPNIKIQNKLIKEDENGNIGFGIIPIANTTAGQMQIGLADSTQTPTGTVSGGGILYSTSGSLHWLDSAGIDVDLTTISGAFFNGGESAGINRTLGNQDNFDLGFLVNNTSLLHLDTAQRVGVGNVLPLHDLHVGPGTTTAFLAGGIKILASNTGAVGLEAMNTTANIESVLYSDTSIGLVGTMTNHSFAFFVDNQEIMRITKGGATNGNLGIGMTSPIANTTAGQRQIGLGDAVEIPVGTVTGGGILYSNSGDLHWLKSDGTDIDLVATAPNMFTGLSDTPSGYTTANSLYKVNSTSNGIEESGLTYNASTLTVPASFYINDGTIARILVNNVTTNLYSGNGTNIVSVANGWVRLISGANMLEINAIGQLISLPTYNNTTASAANMYINSSGLLYRSTSTRKIKKSIKSNVDPEWALKFKPVTFKEKTTNKLHIGFIAEDIRDIDPRFASDGGGDDLPGLELNAIVAAITATIQNQQIQINKLMEIA